jgi:hypothetical protein
MLVRIGQARSRAVLAKGRQLLLPGLIYQRRDRQHAAGVDVQREQVCTSIDGCWRRKGDRAGQMPRDHGISDTPRSHYVFLAQAPGLLDGEHHRLALRCLAYKGASKERDAPIRCYRPLHKDLKNQSGMTDTAPPGKVLT